jgi:preprotein translocase subunit SecF
MWIVIIGVVGLLLVLVCVAYLSAISLNMIIATKGVAHIAVRMDNLEKKLDEIRHELEKIEQK